MTDRRSLVTAVILGAAVAGSPVACDLQEAAARREAAYDTWSSSDAAAGQINMHDVQQAPGRSRT